MRFLSRSCRTDLAAEAHSLHHDCGELTRENGVIAREENVRGFSVTRVEILNPRGEETLGLPCGVYDCMKLNVVPLRSSPDFSEAVAGLATLIGRCLPSPHPKSVLIAALGNPAVTPDALGSLAAEAILVTRHLTRDSLFKGLCSTALCRPGVLGTSGVESAFQVKALCEALRPDCVIGIDALAAAEPDSLCRCVQITDAGIAPGSGIGNNREALNAGFLGVPFLAVGVPTVIDASLFPDLPSLSSLFVTPRDIDTSVHALGRLVGYAVNLALNPTLGLEEMDYLLN